MLRPLLRTPIQLSYTEPCPAPFKSPGSHYSRLCPLTVQLTAVPEPSIESAGEHHTEGTTGPPLQSGTCSTTVTAALTTKTRAVVAAAVSRKQQEFVISSERKLCAHHDLGGPR